MFYLKTPSVPFNGVQKSRVFISGLYFPSQRALGKWMDGILGQWAGKMLGRSVVSVSWSQVMTQTCPRPTCIAEPWTRLTLDKVSPRPRAPPAPWGPSVQLAARPPGSPSFQGPPRPSRQPPWQALRPLSPEAGNCESSGYHPGHSLGPGSCSAS